MGLIPLLPVPLLLAFSDRSVVFALALLIIGVICIVAFEKTQWPALMFVAVTLLGLANLGVARATTKFAWYGVAVFLSVLLFGAVLSGARAHSTNAEGSARRPGAQGRAGWNLWRLHHRDRQAHLPRSRREGRGSDDAQKGTGRIFWVPLADVEEISVGPSQSIKSAARRAPKLLREIYNDRPEQKPSSGKPKATTQETSTQTKSGGKTTTEKKTTVAKSAGESKPGAKRPPPKVQYKCRGANLSTARRPWR